jgi:hypothetical protein
MLHGRRGVLPAERPAPFEESLDEGSPVLSPPDLGEGLRTARGQLRHDLPDPLLLSPIGFPSPPGVLEDPPDHVVVGMVAHNLILS